MSMVIEKWKYNRMIEARILQIKKKLQEIQDIKITYGTCPSMTGVIELAHQVELWKNDLMD